MNHLYFLDTEFVEDGHTIMPISLALVRGDHSDSSPHFLYIEFDFDQQKSEAHPFVRKHVLPHLRNDDRVNRDEARRQIEAFLAGDESPQFWAYYGDYDWVLFCQLWGTMADFPDHFPQLCFDLEQEYRLTAMPHGIEKPPRPLLAHDALADAIWTRELYQTISQIPDHNERLRVLT